MRGTATVVALLSGALFSMPAVAAADPVAPQPNTPCSSNLSDVMTWLPDATMPLVCVNQANGYQWQTVTVPQPPNDRWLSFGPPMTLHGEGLRNPSVKSGDWTATPQDATSRCRAEQQAVVSPGVVGPPQTSEGKAGQPLSLQVVPRLFAIQMSGYCLWVRN